MGFSGRRSSSGIVVLVVPLLVSCVAPAVRETKPAAAPATTSAVPPLSQKPALAPGFRATARNGQVMYCRTYQTTGTRLNNETVCLNERQYQQYVDDTRLDVERIKSGLGGGIGTKPGESSNDP